MRNTIETERLRLICCDEEILNAVLSDDATVANLLNLYVASPWTEAGEQAFQFSLGKISEHPDEKMWWTYLSVLKSENMLIGCCGFRGKPDENRAVEFGYEVALHYRGQGFATEIAQALIDFAFTNEEVKSVCAYTLPEENASVSVLRKCGLALTGEASDSDVGKVWKWELSKNLGGL